MDNRNFFVGSKRTLLKISGGATSGKSERIGGGGILTLFFNLELYPTDFLPFLFDHFYRLLGIGGTSPPVPRRGAATDENSMGTGEQICERQIFRKEIDKFSDFFYREKGIKQQMTGIQRKTSVSSAESERKLEQNKSAKSCLQLLANDQFSSILS